VSICDTLHKCRHYNAHTDTHTVTTKHKHTYRHHIKLGLLTLK